MARRQFWAIARRQLLACGFSPARVRSWLRRGRVHPRYPGVYAWGRPELSVEGQLGAALLYAGEGALGSLTALWWRGLLNRRPTRVHVDSPADVRSHGDIVIRRPRELRRSPHRGLPVVSLPQALLPAATVLSPNALRLVLARAEFERVLSLREVEAALGRGRPGTRALRAALGAHLPQLARCANGLERAFVLLCERACLPLPEPNPRIGRFRPDMLWREAMLIVELDGGRAHSTAAQLAADARRQAELEALGYTVIRFSEEELRRAPDAVVARVRAELVAAAAITA